jgi:glycosyltransferase involved in cell wall biosynthesis
MKLILMQPYLNLQGGVERVILKIAQHYGATIHTLEYNKKTTFPEFSDIDVKIIESSNTISKILPYRASQGFRYGYKFYNLRVKEDYDVINSHISPSEWIRHRNERVLWYCHTPPREVYDLYEVRMRNRSRKDKLIYAAMVGTYKLITKGIVKNIEEIATNSNNTNERIKKYYSRSATVINPGIDCDRFGNDGDDKYFLYPSRIVINKRQDYVIDAFKQFVKKSKNHRYRLVLAGTLSRDPEHAEYLEKLKKQAYGYKVEIIQNPSDDKLIKLYSRCSAVMFAAINEDFGIVPLEGMSSAKPVISVNEGGPRETVLDEKTGFLVNSPAEMASKMMFVSENRKEAEEMGRLGRKRVEAQYTWQSFFKKFDVALRKVSKSRE